MLLDSNIIIYAAQPSHQVLRQFIAAHAPAVSAVGYTAFPMPRPKYARVAAITFGASSTAEVIVGIAMSAKLRSMRLRMSASDDVAPTRMLSTYATL